MVATVPVVGFMECGSVRARRVFNEDGVAFACDQHILFFVHVPPSLVKINMLPSSTVFLTLISDIGNFCNVSASAVCLDSCGKGSYMAILPLLVLPLATPTHFVDRRRIGSPAGFLSALLM